MQTSAAREERGDSGVKEVLKRRLAGGAVLLALLFFLWSLFDPTPPGTSLPPVPAPPAFQSLNLPADFGGTALPRQTDLDAPSPSPTEQAGAGGESQLSPAPQSVPAAPAVETAVPPVPAAEPRAAAQEPEEETAVPGRARERSAFSPVRWRVRVGVYARPQGMMEQLRTDGFKPSRGIWKISGEQLLYAVYAGDDLSRWQAEELRQEVDRRYQISSLVERVESGSGR